MKKAIFMATILSLLMTGCTQEQNEENNQEEIITSDEEVSDSIILAGCSEEGKELDSLFQTTELIRYSYQMPNIELMNADAKETVELFLDQEKEAFEEKKECFYWEADDWYREQQSYESEEDRNWGILWEYYINYAVTQNDEKYVSLLEVNYSFAGGAHGSSTYRGIVLDAETGEELTLDDFLSGKENEKIYLAEYLAEQLTEEVEYLWPDYADTIVYNICYEPDFYIEENKLVFVFDAYELGCYAVGPQFIEIPIKMLNNLENAGQDKEQVLTYAERMKKPEALNRYLVEMGAGEASYADLDGDGQEEEILFPVDDGVNGCEVTIFIDRKEFSFYVDENVIEEYIGLVDLNSEDGKYELAVYAYGPSSDLITFFYRYADGELYEIGTAEGIFDRQGRIEGKYCIFGDGEIYGEKVISNLLETRWITCYWQLVPETDELVWEEKEYYAYYANPYGARQREYPYWLHNSLVLYEENSRESMYEVVGGEDSRITRFYGSDDKNWVRVEIFTDDGLKWGWIYVDENNIEIEKDVYESAWKVIDNLFLVD